MVYRVGFSILLLIFLLLFLLVQIHSVSNYSTMFYAAEVPIHIQLFFYSVSEYYIRF